MREKGLAAIGQRPQGIRTLFLASLLFLLLGALFGFYQPSLASHLAQPVLHQMKQSVQSLEGHSWFRFFLYIFLHNTFSIAMTMLLGVVFGLFPAWNMWLNGMVIGYLLHADAQLGIPAGKLILYGLAPHGIFELTAVFWASAVGLLNGWTLLTSLLNAFRNDSVVNHPVSPEIRKESVWRIVIRYNLRAFPFMVGLLLIAAVIESTVTPHLIQVGIGSLHVSHG
ncbi:stage II sporulation protein M [Alicyclobacillus tolerans]|uniref:Stage II sporulation protein M n=1 Tax=Alicyclobacillus tolerans TaxID=90970 RepID=A0A1M6WX00_9BACL|nr:stage II sporulation protein M [Alicyclobacillus montanus]SHK98206.1 stage II sporulation protein M [Alicyclobacillus montanus]